VGGGKGVGKGAVPVSVRRMVKVKVSGEHLGVIVELQKLGMAFRHSREQL
jgi:hypothetical protein